MGTLRRVGILWGTKDTTVGGTNDTPVSTGAGGKSGSTNIGGATYVTLFIKVDGATNVTVECAPGLLSAGRNEGASITNWFPLFKPDGSAVYQITFAGAGSATINLGSFGSEWVRLSSSANVNALAYADAI